MIMGTKNDKQTPECDERAADSALSASPGSPRFSYSFDEEHYCGSFESREDAVEEAFALNEDAEFCYTGENYVPQRVVSASSVIEQVVESMTEDAGEWAEDYFDPGPTREQEEELQSLLQAAWDKWESKHSFQPTWFNVCKVQQHVRENKK